MKMASMKMTKTEKTAMTEAPKPADGPEYPYGLCLRLEKDQIKKLDLSGLSAKDEVAIQAKAFVKTVTASDRADGDGYQDIEIQITDLAIGKPPKGREDKELADAMFKKGART